MSDIKNDSRIVLTLDAGGTNMVFGAMKGGEYYGNTITLPSNANNLDLCLQAMVLGFGTIIERLGDEKPESSADSFPTSLLSGTELLSDPSSRRNSEFPFSSTMTVTSMPTERLLEEPFPRSTRNLKRPAVPSATITSSATLSEQVSE